MDVASLELCRGLFALSGWTQTTYEHELLHGKYYTTTLPSKDMSHGSQNTYIPAYDLSYLLQKLYACGPVLRLDLEARPDAGQGKYFIWIFQENIDIRLWANTPEDAACKLALELFRQGILKRRD